MDDKDVPVELKRMSLQYAQLIGRLKGYKSIKRQIDAEYDRWIDATCLQVIDEDEAVLRRISTWPSNEHVRSSTNASLRKQEYIAEATKGRLDKEYADLHQNLNAWLQERARLCENYERLNKLYTEATKRNIDMPCADLPRPPEPRLREWRPLTPGSHDGRTPSPVVVNVPLSKTPWQSDDSPTMQSHESMIDRWQ